MFRAKFPFFLLIVTFMTFASPARAVSEPAELIVTLSDEVFAILETHREGYAEDPAPMRLELVKLLEPVTDFDAFSRGVMGPFYDQATAEQKTRFVTIFRDSLVKIYSDGLSQSEIISITEKETRMSGADKATVVLLVSSRIADPYTIQFSLRQSEVGDWKVRNIIVGGVNIGLTFRNQFASAMDMNGGDLEQVIADWPQIVEGQS